MRLHLPRGRALLAEKRSLWAALGWAAAALAIPTAIKFGLDTQLPNVPPFLTYFPAVTLAALVLGFRWGSAVLFGAAILGDYFFMAPYFSWSLSFNDAIVLLLFVAGGALIVVTGEAMRKSALELQASAKREHELNAELKHRVNNNLAVVQALASQAARANPYAADFFKSFGERLSALREAHDVLSSTDWMSCDLPRLAERALKAFQSGGAVSLGGSPVVLPPESCVPLTLCLHELGTNSLKFGALSTPEGRVSVRWEREGKGIVLRWIEQSGPTVQPPTHKGLGVRLLRSQPGLDEVTVEYRPDGVQCTIKIAGARPA